MTEDQIITAIISLAILVASGFAGFAVFKLKLRQFRDFVVNLDDALEDNAVTEDEYRKLWASFMRLMHMHSIVKPGG